MKRINLTVIMALAFSAALVDAVAERPPPLTCASLDCIPGFICTMINGKPVCRPGRPRNCNAIDCKPGYHCEMVKGVPTCLPDITCALVLCKPPLICVMKNGKPTCVEKPKPSCKTVKCAAGNHCVENPQGPKCIPNITCANVRCSGPCKDTPSGPVCLPRPHGQIP